MAKIELKQPIVKEIAELLDGAQAAVVVDYRGLSAEQDTKLRKELREAGVTYKVYKNTMIRIAAKVLHLRHLTVHLKDLQQLQYQKKMQLLRLEYFTISLRQLRTLS